MTDHEPYVYIAGPFFNPTQKNVIGIIEKILKSQSIKCFSPGKECMFEPGVTTPQQILDMNIDALKQCSHVIAVTDGKDVGTMFEAGYCYATGVNIIYLWLTGKPEDKFNLMLAASGRVCRSYDQLDDMLEHIEEDKYAIQQEIHYE